MLVLGVGLALICSTLTHARSNGDRLDIKKIVYEA
jgi:hypothetical protein